MSSTPLCWATAWGCCQRTSRPRAARARARQCDGACTRTQGCLRNTNRPGRSHARARRGIARASGAQCTQQLERRQRGGDRAPAQHAVAASVFVREGTGHGYSRVVLNACVGDERYAGALEDTNGPAQQRRSHAGARRGSTRAAGAQETQQLEHRQRVGDRAVELVRGEIPARPRVRTGNSQSTSRRGVQPRGTAEYPTALGDCRGVLAVLEGHLELGLAFSQGCWKGTDSGTCGAYDGYSRSTCRGALRGTTQCAGAHICETAVSAEMVAGSEPTKPG